MLLGWVYKERQGQGYRATSLPLVLHKAWGQSQPQLVWHAESLKATLWLWYTWLLTVRFLALQIHGNNRKKWSICDNAFCVLCLWNYGLANLYLFIIYYLFQVRNKDHYFECTLVSSESHWPLLWSMKQSYWIWWVPRYSKIVLQNCSCVASCCFQQTVVQASVLFSN